MWLVFYRRQRMLTQGHTPDPKCKFIVSLFLIFPHLLDCLICTRNAMSIVQLLKMMERWNGWGWLIYISVWVGGQLLGIILQFLLFSYASVFCSVMLSVPLFRLQEHNGCCVCFFVISLFSLSLAALTRTFQCIKIVVSVV